MASFVERFDVWTPEQARAAEELARRLEAGEVDVVRFAFPDLHGILRGKTLVASEAVSALRGGVNMTTTLFAKDTSHLTVFPVFSAGGGFDFEGMQGAADFVMVADPATFRVLPWSPRTGWVLCDAYMTDGRKAPLETRGILRRALGLLEEQGMSLTAGLEVEFHVFRVEDPKMGLHDGSQQGQPGLPPEVSLLTHGYQYLTEQRYDATEDLMELLRTTMQGLQLPVHSMEIEFGPSQFELTFGPMPGMMAADAMVLVRSAVKQVCQRHGYHATFMCRPKIPNVMSSGWHLHQSLCDLNTGRNLFIPEKEGSDLSEVGYQYLAGLLAHAAGAAPLSTPTINGYRRYRSFSLAPDRASWGRDNRGAMLRVLGGVGQAATRIENRVGEPCANPYLYMASQVFSGLDGIQRKLQPCPSADEPYEDTTEPLPRSLPDALRALRQDEYLCQQLTPQFVNYYCHIKEAELSRFNQAVTEWEQREYFTLF
ncbi:MAG TPA: glutamine synthetase family protein [Pusillimonas sp.]|uniref:glutamine synthetase family protein n=1 Tax=unclassified Pusillimonas TaxID=2640016 RepID=UPI002639B55F|nr:MULTISPECIES: glutamine synthetase family protein [unclassified Pusillimonas]HLU19368.1 glutamine synthetase family protein [Pusillimonas sp.]